MNPSTRRPWSLLRAALPALLLALLTAARPAAADEPPFAPRQALVRLTPQEPIAAFQARYGVTLLRSIPERNIHLVGLPADPDEPSFVALFDADPAVVFADLNFIADDTDADGTTQDIFLARDQPQYQNDPTPRLIGADQAHIAARGRGVTVAILDSGLDPAHPALAGRIAPGGYNFIDDNTKTADVGPGLFAGHGTLVAGIVARVAPEATILPLRIMDSDGQSTTFQVARAVYHAIDRGATVINISLGTTADPDLLRAAISEAIAAGVTVVAAAGNDDAESPPRSPAGLSGLGVIAVAALDQASLRAPFTNYGSWISISAPGIDVHGPIPAGGFGAATGTSFAAPLVSGAAALVRSACPSAAGPTVRAHLLQGASPIDQLNPSYPGQLGTGRLDAPRALALALHGAAFCRCPADFDGSGAASVQDLFAFLSAWFDSSPLADLDASGDAGVQDLFDFLGNYFTGCP